MKGEFSIISDNIQKLLLSTNSAHSKILSNNLKVLRNKYELRSFDKKKKRKKKQKREKNLTI